MSRRAAPFTLLSLALGLVVALALAPAKLWAQDLKIAGREVQIHGFASQGFVHTDDNNWLTMETSGLGSGEFTDFGANASTQITDRFRIGAQLYDRNLGALGKWRPSLDWGFADYKFRNWLGLRGGKVKTTVGLYNDTQDLDFLRVFVLLPQSMYPTDLRDASIAHEGGDVYGTATLRHHLGSAAYNAYAGHRSDSIYSGYPYLLTQFGTRFTSFGGLQYGGDLRWLTPLRGLQIGASRLDQDTKGVGTSVNQIDPSETIPYSEHSRSDWTDQYYGSYAAGRIRLDAEYRRYYRDQLIFAGTSEDRDDIRGCYVAGSYQITRRLAVGSYYSRYTVSERIGGQLAEEGFPSHPDTSLPANHIYDKVVAAKIDLKTFWYVKVEGHFMSGYGENTYPDGFYPQENPEGFNNDTNALVLKTGLHF